MKTDPDTSTLSIAADKFRLFDFTDPDNKTLRTYATRERLNTAIDRLASGLLQSFRSSVTLVPLCTPAGRHTALFILRSDTAHLTTFFVNRGFAVYVGG